MDSGKTRTVAIVYDNEYASLLGSSSILLEALNKVMENSSILDEETFKVCVKAIEEANKPHPSAKQKFKLLKFKPKDEE